MTALISEKAGELDIEIEEGTDFDSTLTWTDSNAALIDLTGYSATLQMRAKAGLTGTPDLELTDGAGITLGGALGTIQIQIADTQNVFGNKTYFYDLELTDAAGAITRLIRGTIKSIAEVTK